MGKITIVYSRDKVLIGEIPGVEVTRANGKGTLSEPGGSLLWKLLHDRHPSGHDHIRFDIVLENGARLGKCRLTGVTQFTYSPKFSDDPAGGVSPPTRP